MVTYTYIRRGSFARESIVRRAVHVAYRRACPWCGSRDGRFTYGVLRDDRGVPSWDAHSFCSIGCRTAYMGG